MKSEFDPESDSDIIDDVVECKSGSKSRLSCYTNLDAEKVSEGFGNFGTYQMLVCAMINIGYFLYAYESRIFSLIIEKPKFTCNHVEGYNTTLDQCEYFDPELNSTAKCSSFSYKEERNSYLTSEFDLVCDNAYYGEHVLSIFMLGSMLFTPILTQLADLYGRRIAYLMSLWLTVLANIGCALASSYIAFLVFVFIAGIGATGLGTVGYVIVLEMVTPVFRPYAPLISTFVWVAGYTTVGVIHMYIKPWRWQLFTFVTPFILTFTYYWLLPETIHWLITHNKTTKVKRWIKTFEKVNKKKLNLKECRNSVPSTPDEGGSEKDNHRRTFLDIFSNGPMVFQFVCQSFIMVAMNFTYWALSFFATELHENKMIGYFLSNFVELPAAFTTFLLVYFGRRTVMSLSLLAQAVAMCIAVFYPGQNTVSMILFLLVKGFNGFIWVAEPLLISEMAPTSTRNMFCGIIEFIGKFGSITAPYFNRLKIIHEAAPAVAMAILSLIAGLMAMCSPETMNVRMPEDIDDFDPGPVYAWIFGKPKKRNTAINAEINANEGFKDTEECSQLLEH